MEGKGTQTVVNPLVSGHTEHSIISDNALGRVGHQSSRPWGLRRGLYNIGGLIKTSSDVKRPEAGVPQLTLSSLPCLRRL